jgi:hypothetical protein
MIICFAIKTFDNQIYVGKRHNNIIKDNPCIDFKHGIQGFMNDKLKFLDRREALKEAIESGQVKLSLLDDILLSEDLY